MLWGFLFLSLSFCMKFCKAVCWNSQGFLLFCLFKGGVIRREIPPWDILLQSWSGVTVRSISQNWKKQSFSRMPVSTLERSLTNINQRGWIWFAKVIFQKIEITAEIFHQERWGRNPYINFYLVCSRPAIKLMLWKSNTRYSSCPSGSPTKVKEWNMKKRFDLEHYIDLHISMTMT